MDSNDKRAFDSSFNADLKKLHEEKRSRKNGTAAAPKNGTSGSSLVMPSCSIGSADSNPILASHMSTISKSAVDLSQEVFDLTDDCDDVCVPSSAAVAPKVLLAKILSTGTKNSSKPIKNDYVAALPEGKPFCLISYNVWFKEEVCCVDRIRAICTIIGGKSPDAICLQEVTYNIYRIFMEAMWWNQYEVSIKPHELSGVGSYFVVLLIKKQGGAPITFKRQPFGNSIMGRELVWAEDLVNKRVVATTHLESPVVAWNAPSDFHVASRQTQLCTTMGLLDSYQCSGSGSGMDVYLAGDFNWTEERYKGGNKARHIAPQLDTANSDGPITLGERWFDAWLHHHRNKSSSSGGGCEGYTYDTTANPMLKGSFSLRERLDRCFFQNNKNTHQVNSL